MRLLERLCGTAAVACATVASAQPANDLCTNAAGITFVSGMATTAVSTSGASEDGPRASCGRIASNGQLVPTRDVWYVFTSGVSSYTEVAASNCSSGIYFGLTATVFNACPPGGSPLADVCAGDICYGGPLRFFAQSGQTYYIRVASMAISSGGSAQQGTATLTITQFGAPSNNLCASARTLVVTDGVAQSPVDTRGATKDGPAASCSPISAGQPVNSNDVWYRYVATTTGEADIQALDCVGLSRGLGMTFFDGCTGQAITGRCSQSICGSLVFTLPTQVGQELYIRLCSYAGTATGLPQEGTATLRITEVSPPGNNNCAAAENVGPGSHAWNDRLATLDGSTSCSSSNFSAPRDIWFLYTASSTGMAAIDCGGVEVALTAFQGGCGGSELTCDQSIGTNNDLATNFNWMGFPVIAGQQYLIRIARRLGDPVGPGLLNISEYAVPSGDSCGAAVTVVAGGNSLNNLGVRDIDPSDAGATLSNMAMRWFKYTPQGSGTVTFDVTPGMAMSVYDSCGSPANSSTIKHSHLAVKAQPGVPIYVRVGAISFPYYRSFTLTIAEISTAQYDVCETTPQVGIPGMIEFNNYNATQPTIVPTPFCEYNPTVPGKSDVWVKVIAPGAGVIGASTCWIAGMPAHQSADHTIIVVHRDSCSGPQITCNEVHESGNRIDYSCYTEQSSLQFDAVPGVAYHIRVAVRWQSIGPGRLNLYFTPTACPADFNDDGARDVADLFAYINAWLAKTTNADFNNSGNVDVADLFAYINAWLAGC